LPSLGRRVGLTAPAVAERGRRLEGAGVIRGYHADVDPRALGLELSVVLRIRPAARMIAKVAELAQETPEVTECHRVTGEDCFVMRLHVRDVVHLEELIDRFVLYGQTTTSIVQSSPCPARRSRRVACNSWPILACPSRSAGRGSMSPQSSRVEAPVLDAARGRLGGTVRIAQHRAADRRRRRQLDANRERLAACARPTARALRLRAPGARHGRAARDRAAGGCAAGQAPRTGRRRARGCRRARFRRRLPAVMLAGDGAVAALHMRLAGLAGGIVAEGVAALRELGADRCADRRARPVARAACCYEVGEEVHAAFAGVPGACVGVRKLDLPAFVRTGS
jgi:Lrp/AsnC family leucine-responsive transcriptional regulator